MVEWWEVLGVEPDADLRAVKRAYAGKLKALKLNENPQAFMDLRAAYDIAKSTSDIKYYDEVEPYQLEIVETGQNDVDCHLPSLEENSSYGMLMVQIRNLLSDSTRVSDYDIWLPIIKKSHNLGIDDYQEFQKDLYEEVLMASNYYEDNAKKIIPREIVKLLVDEYNWNMETLSEFSLEAELEFLANVYNLEELKSLSGLSTQAKLKQVLKDVLYISLLCFCVFLVFGLPLLFEMKSTDFFYGLGRGLGVIGIGQVLRRIIPDFLTRRKDYWGRIKTYPSIRTLNLINIIYWFIFLPIAIMFYLSYLWVS